MRAFGGALAERTLHDRDGPSSGAVVPVTAKLSKAFYDRLGEQIANELVEWFNQVDATYRSDLRDINELNFARFDAKLEQRLAEFDAKIEQRLTESDAKIDRRFGDLETRIERRFGDLEVRLERRLGEQTRFFFLAWAVLLASNIALWFR